MFDSPTLHKVQTYFGGHNTGTPALIEVLCDNALDGIGWMEDLGVVAIGMKTLVLLISDLLCQRSIFLRSIQSPYKAVIAASGYRKESAHD